MMTTIHARRALAPDGWQNDLRVTLSGGRIAACQRGAAQPGDTRVDTLLPAPANLHSHAFQRAMAGLSERRGPDARDSFWTWRALMFRFLDRMTPEDVQAITAMAQVEMAEAGFAACVEFHYLHHAPGGGPYADLAEMSARVAAAADRTGLGLTLAPVLYQVGGCDGRELAPGQVRFGNDPDRFARLLEGAGAVLRGLPDDSVLAVAPHSLRAVTGDGLTACVALAGDSMPLHIHLSEQLAEVDEVRAAHGGSPVDVLFDRVDVGRNWCLIHCTQATAPEIDRIAASGAVVGLCPITESSLGDGIFDAVRLRMESGRFGIGTDSNIRISVPEELRTLEYSQRLRDRGRAVLATDRASTGRVLFDAALAGGAQAAGRESGRIAPGALADLVALGDDDGLHALRSDDTILDAWIFAGDTRAVRDLWSAGRHIVTEGRHVARDAVAAAYRASLARLLGAI